MTELISFWIVVAAGWSVMAVLSRRHHPPEQTVRADGPAVGG